jgi:trk system potassium uptake protein TrkH
MRRIIAGFLGLILIGGILLGILEKDYSWIDLFFVSASAVTVTGLSTFPIFKLSFLSQIVILVLIQLGGLGIMTAGGLIFSFLGRLSLAEKETLSKALEVTFRKDLLPLIRFIVLATLLIEFFGALLYFYHFYFKLGFLLKKSVFFAVFHSVSSFCNAGLTLFPESFQSFGNDLLFNFNAMILIVLGGLGFLVLRSLKRRFQSLRFYRMDLHSKLVIYSSLILIFGAAFLLLGFEYQNLEGDLSQKMLSSLFQSVTSRTAGFTTIEISEISPPSQFLFMVLMFVGAGPLSTSGGVKIIPVVLVILAVIFALRGRGEVEIFKRTVPREIIFKSFLILIVFLSLILGFCLLLLWTEKACFEKVIFEAVSAFGTVGLSLGLTPNLTLAGKILIIVLMLVGRLGPLSLIYLLAKKPKVGVYLPEEKEPIALS